MAQIWDADVRLSAEQAAALLVSQCPQVGAIEQMTLLGEGWDNWAYLINNTWVVRFPRRAIAVDLLRHETRWLARLAPSLPLRIPHPELQGEPADGYPYPFAGYRLIEGRTSCGVPWRVDQQSQAAEHMGAFLRALHAAHPQQEGETVPHDAIHRAILPPRANQTSDRLDLLGKHVPNIEAIREAVYALSTTAFRQGPLCWVHGDLYPRHLLVDDNDIPCAVIDWGDVHVGDPALDLMGAYVQFDEPARTVFFDTYGPTTTAMRDRARFRALYYGVALLSYGLDQDDADLRRVGHEALVRALPSR